jgi:D-xylonolactonase
MDGAPVSAWPLAAELGEGPSWIDGALWFVDIKRHAIHCFDPERGARRSWTAPEQVGFIVPRTRGGFIAGLQSGLHAFDPASGTFDLIVAVEPDRPGNRLNDAVVDPFGRLWFGTMDDGEQAATGAFYCYVGGKLIPTGIGDIAITNGPAISPDGRLLYWVDTLGRDIWVADIGPDGLPGPSRLFTTIALADGYPDGPTVDADGCVWVGLYGGWEARRYSPDGTLIGQVRFPVANITKVAFGGVDGRTLFVTTARQLLTAEQLESQPSAGDLFSCPSEVRGLPCHSVID